MNTQPVDASRRLARWRLRLSELDFDFVHRAGGKRQAVYALSRVHTDGKDITTIDDNDAVCNAEVAQLSDEKINYEHMYTEYDDIRGKSSARFENDPTNEIEEK